MIYQRNIAFLNPVTPCLVGWDLKLEVVSPPHPVKVEISADFKKFRIVSFLLTPCFLGSVFCQELEKTGFRFVRDRESDEIHLFLYRRHLIFNNVFCSKHKVLRTWKTVYFITFPVSDEPKTCFFEFLAKN